MTEKKTDKVHDYHSKYEVGEVVYWCDSKLHTYKGEIRFVRFDANGEASYKVTCHGDAPAMPEWTKEESIFRTEREAKVHAGQAMMKLLQDKMVQLATFMKDVGE